jgi:hypothetical protein
MGAPFRSLNWKKARMQWQLPTSYTAEYLKCVSLFEDKAAVFWEAEWENSIEFMPLGT